MSLKQKILQAFEAFKHAQSNIICQNLKGIKLLLKKKL